MAVNFYTVKKESKEQFENILEKMTGKWGAMLWT
jgi:hypothetical protein